VHDVYWKDYSISSFHNNSGLNSLTKCLTMDQSLNKAMEKLIKEKLTT